MPRKSEQPRGYRNRTEQVGTSYPNPYEYLPTGTQAAPSANPTLRATKIKKDRRTFHADPDAANQHQLYFIKSYTTETMRSGFVGFEAAIAELYSFALGYRRASKAKHIQYNPTGTAAQLKNGGFVSKKIPGNSESFYDLAIKDFNANLAWNNQRKTPQAKSCWEYYMPSHDFIRMINDGDLGSVVAASRALLENDLHWNNLFLNGNGEFSRIDFDQSLIPWRNSFSASNMIERMGIFKDVTPEHLEHLIDPDEQKFNPFNNILKLGQKDKQPPIMLSNSLLGIHLFRLEDGDVTFQMNKWKIFIKFALLSVNDIEEIFAAHMPSDLTENETHPLLPRDPAGIARLLYNRFQNYFHAMIKSRNFREIWESYGGKIQQDIINEITVYNLAHSKETQTGLQIPIKQVKGFIYAIQPINVLSSPTLTSSSTGVYPFNTLPWPYSDHLPQLSPDGKILTFNMMTQMRYNRPKEGTGFYNNGFGIGQAITGDDNSWNEADETYKMRIEAQAAVIADIIASTFISRNRLIETICLQEAPSTLELQDAFYSAFTKRLSAYPICEHYFGHLSLREGRNNTMTYTLNETQVSEDLELKTQTDAIAHLSSQQQAEVKKHKALTIIQKNDGTVVVNLHGNYQVSIWPFVKALTAYFLRKNLFPIFTGDFNRHPGQDPIPVGFIFTTAGAGSFSHPASFRTITPPIPIVNSCLDGFIVPNISGKTPSAYLDTTRTPANFAIPSDIDHHHHAQLISFDRYLANFPAGYAMDNSWRKTSFLTNNQYGITSNTGQYPTSTPTATSTTVRVTQRMQPAPRPAKPVADNPTIIVAKPAATAAENSTPAAPPAADAPVSTPPQQEADASDTELDMKMKGIASKIQEQANKLKKDHPNESTALGALKTQIDSYYTSFKTLTQRKTPGALNLLTDIAEKAITIQKRNDLRIAQSRGKGQLRRGFINVALMATLIGLIALLLITYGNKPGLRQRNFLKLLATGNATFWKTTTESALDKATKVAETIKNQNTKN